VRVLCVEGAGLVRKTIDIAGNIHRIEWLKSELLSALSDLYRVLIDTKETTKVKIVDCLSSVVLACYLLARRLGVSYEAVDQGVRDKVKLGLLEEPDIETRFGDLTLLKDHMRDGRMAPLAREGSR
jgi:hypothetical protein